MSSPAVGRDRVPPQWGGPLSESDYATLAASWITPEIAAKAMLRRVGPLEGREVIGQKGNRDCAGILFPYYWPGILDPFNYRLRRDNPEFAVDKEGRPKPNRKYLGPPRGANRLYVPPGITLAELNNVAIPIALVEGEKKALALWRLANHDTETPRVIPIAIPGVWNWRGKIGKADGPKGERLDVSGPIPDLSRIPWDGRTVFVVFDTNVHTNDSVKLARSGISRELTSRNAGVKLVDLPEDSGVNGVDDLLVKWGPERVLELFDAATSGVQLDVKVPPQFPSRPDGMFLETAHGDRLSRTPLANFRAKILTNTQLDDGVEAKREFEIEAELFGRTTHFVIPASEFVQMNWVIEQLGAAAIIYPNQREYARTAIQWNSLTATEQHIYTHTGWRKLNGRSVYLHAAGAIDAVGVVPATNVRLAGALSRYELRLPSSASDLKAAVKASLRLLDIGPPSISFPLLAATCRAVFGDADFALHIVGATGSFKSALAALYQQHFGPAMDRLNLPGAWASTGNALEALAFHAKDALIVIDDFAPPGGGNELARYQAAAERVFRAAGNHAGRGRLDSATKLRESKPPRALILSTGEDIPKGQSVRARLLILELTMGDVDAAFLTESQSNAGEGLYSQSMAAFVQWLAGRYDEVCEVFKSKLSEHRAKALVNAAHARTPDIIASLQAGMELYLEFAVACGAIDVAEACALGDRCWNALLDTAASQVKHQGEMEPTGRFLAIVRSLLTSGRAHLASRSNDVPEQTPESCGWKQDNANNWNSLGDCIGWVDDDIYLDLTAAYRVAQIAGRDIGEMLAVSEQTLKKRLHERNLLASVDKARQTLTVRRSICGSSKNVLHLLRTTILSDAPEDRSEEEG